jgi:hypothetical protein
MPKPHRLTFWQETWPNGMAQGNAGSEEFWLQQLQQRTAEG